MPTPPAHDCAPSPAALFLQDDWPHAARAVRTGELRRVARGVFAVAAEWEALAPWDRYLGRVHAHARTHPDAVFTLESAAALRGLPVFGEPAHVHVVVAPPAKSYTVHGVRVHSAERLPRSERLGGIQVATPDEIAVALACARHPAVGLAVANAVLRADGALTGRSLQDLALARRTARAIRSATWVFARATRQTESTLEDVSLAVLEWLGFEAPQLQRWFRGSDGDDRVDFWWERERVAGEADGEVKYRGDGRPALRDRNVRDARLMRRGVRATAHWAWPDTVASEQLRAILLAAGLRPVRPPDIAPLASLRSALYPARYVARLR